MKTVSDFTVGTVIVLAHVALADRRSPRSDRALQTSGADGSRLWRTQISP